MPTDPLPRQDIAEGAPYDHPDHGRVVVVLIDDGVVYYEQPRSTKPLDNPMYKTPLDRFRHIVTPAPQTVTLPDATATADTSLGGL